VALSAYSRCRNSSLAVRVLLAQVHVDQAPVAADAVADVHHRVADVQLGQVLDQRLDVADLLLLLAAARGGAGGEEFGLGDEVEAVFQPGVPEEAGGQRGGGDADFSSLAWNSASESKLGG
jgi:hypothetical protein